MMTGMTPATAATMGLVCVLAIIVLGLAEAALVQYLRSGNQARPE